MQQNDREWADEDGFGRPQQHRHAGGDGDQAEQIQGVVGQPGVEYTEGSEQGLPALEVRRSPRTRRTTAAGRSWR
jgi:hypothetical protein